MAFKTKVRTKKSAKQVKEEKPIVYITSNHPIFYAAALMTEEELNETLCAAQLCACLGGQFAVSRFVGTYQDEIHELVMQMCEAKTPEELVKLYDRFFKMAIRDIFKTKEDRSTFYEMVNFIKSGKKDLDNPTKYDATYETIFDNFTDIFMCIMSKTKSQERLGVNGRCFIINSIDAARDVINENRAKHDNVEIINDNDAPTDGGTTENTPLEGEVVRIGYDSEEPTEKTAKDVPLEGEVIKIGGEDSKQEPTETETKTEEEVKTDDSEKDVQIPAETQAKFDEIDRQINELDQSLEDEKNRRVKDVVDNILKTVSNMCGAVRVGMRIGDRPALEVAREYIEKMLHDSGMPDKFDLNFINHVASNVANMINSMVNINMAAVDNPAAIEPVYPTTPTELLNQNAAIIPNNTVRVDFTKFVKPAEAPAPTVTPKDIMPQPVATPAPMYVNPQQIMPQPTPAPVPMYVSPQQIVPQPTVVPQQQQVVNATAQNVPTVEAEVVETPKVKQLPNESPVKSNMYNHVDLKGVPVNDKVALLKKHFKFIEGTHPDVSESEVDSLLSLISKGLLLKDCREAGIRYPNTGLDFIEITTDTYKLASKKSQQLTWAFRTKQTTKKGEPLVVYVDPVVKHGKRADYFDLYAFMPSNLNEDGTEKTSKHPEGCKCGKC